MLSVKLLKSKTLESLLLKKALFIGAGIFHNCFPPGIPEGKQFVGYISGHRRLLSKKGPQRANR